MEWVCQTVLKDSYFPGIRHPSFGQTHKTVKYCKISVTFSKFTNFADNDIDLVLFINDSVLESKIDLDYMNA